MARPHTRIRMGAGTFTVTVISSADCDPTHVDLNNVPRLHGDTRPRAATRDELAQVASALCQLHGIKGRRPRTKTPRRKAA